MHPVGPLNPKVYWIRRVSIVVLAVALLIGVVWFLASRTSRSSASQHAGRRSLSRLRCADADRGARGVDRPDGRFPGRGRCQCRRGDTTRVRFGRRRCSGRSSAPAGSPRAASAAASSAAAPSPAVATPAPGVVTRGLVTRGLVTRGLVTRGVVTYGVVTRGGRRGGRAAPSRLPSRPPSPPRADPETRRHYSRIETASGTCALVRRGRHAAVPGQCHDGHRDQHRPVLRPGRPAHPRHGGDEYRQRRLPA